MPKDLDNLPADRSPLAADAPTAERSEPAGQPEATAAAPEQPRETGDEAKGGSRKRIVLGALALAAIVAGGWYGHDYWTNGRFLVSTDDAYVQADFAILAPKVTGYVASVPARENEHVKAGDPLVILRDGDYRDALNLAQSQLDAQLASVDRINRQAEAAKAAITQSEAKVTAAKAVQVQAEADLKRYTELAKTDVATSQKLEAARAASATADADVSEAEAGVLTAQADLRVVEAQASEARAVLSGLTASRDKARRDLDDTVLRAPTDGVVGNLSVATGDYVTPGARLLAVVPLGQVYIEANYKETQIEQLAPGTRVEVEVDAFPDRAFTGTLQGVSPASGSVFSLLPPENATGNFTKVVQRLPVRIAVPEEVARAGWLRPGLSVVATADPRTSPDSPAPGAPAGAPEGARLSANETPAR
ncbi:HlyD family secretion protein [Amaricoccus solimangrovi]|uniref:HlyD family secretion protein n=1 Tax=Amaricoccus solimangrovi TaxID=2589815 RepID=A0A501X0S9_9RHOB|nr:HlyD family secretion protein [Amaricoccus solimangrovi]TPE53551.1 HlyD family secretion protein [Amaricoccus solimangrovi]